MEPLLACHSEKFQKYNDNQGGYQSDSYSAHVANAFSHFSHVASGGELVICDIQGVGEYYTDPQIHTALLPEFLETFHSLPGLNRHGKMPFDVFQDFCFSNMSLGLGNFGWEGLQRFVKSHICNSVCAALGLEPFIRENGSLPFTSLRSEFPGQLILQTTCNSLKTSPVLERVKTTLYRSILTAWPSTF
ncbi:Alpha-protein kinase 1 [Galdieria sulphuraria]|nr:Alpha-protein kinase 1 [Galdieria sulphuraria]